MNEQTIKFLETLSSKLGTTAEQLWSVLLAQAQVNTFIYPFQIIIYSLIIYLYYRYCKKIAAKHDDANSVSFPIFCICIVGGIISIILSFVIFFKIQALATCIFNPDYWALQQILQGVNCK